VGSQQVLIVGGDSFIGRALGNKHRDRGDEVTCTTRRPQHADAATYLDLRDVPGAWSPPERVDVAYLCAAVARVDDCAKNPAATKAVNVDGTLRVARALLLDGVFVVLLSTNYVFSDANPRPSPQDPYDPVTEYGRQKAAAERGFSALPGRKAIVRLTKVLGSQSALVDQWRRALRTGQQVVAFDDVNIAPMSLRFAADALYRVGSQKRAGVHHLSGREDVSYLGLAKVLAAKLGVSAELVRGQSYKDANAAFASPRHGSLDMSAAAAELDLEPQRAEDVVADLLTHG
jgi:dTDP-4-dehydrorhamnose reductase